MSGFVIPGNHEKLVEPISLIIQRFPMFKNLTHQSFKSCLTFFSPEFASPNNDNSPFGRAEVFDVPYVSLSIIFQFCSPEFNI